MLQLKPSTYVHKAEVLECAYSISQEEIKANVHFSLILDLCLRFLHLNKDKKLFFYLETPDGLSREADVSSDTFSKNPTQAFRVDFESFEKASALLFYFADLLLKDGLCRYKFGTNEGDEFSVGKYNIITVTGENVERYEELFINAKIPKTEKLITAYDTFSKETPGFTKSSSFKGISVMEIPEYLKMYGIIS